MAIKIETILHVPFISFQYMKGAFEKAFDKKSQWIRDLEGALGKNEVDYEEATNSHLYQVDKMMGKLMLIFEDNFH